MGARGGLPSSGIRILMSYAFISKKSLVIFFQRRRPVRIDSTFEAAYPCIVDDAAVFKVMIRMVVGNEDVAKIPEINPCQNCMPAGAISTIYYIRDVIGYNEYCLLGSHLVWSWTSFFIITP